MAKYNYYAIARGIDPKNKCQITNMIFKTWEEAKPYVVSASNARYKGFLTEEEAKLWLSIVQDEEMENLKNQMKNSSEEEIDIICKKLKISRNTLVKHLEERFVEEYKWMHNRVTQQGGNLPWN